MKAKEYLPPPSWEGGIPAVFRTSMLDHMTFALTRLTEAPAPGSLQPKSLSLSKDKQDDIRLLPGGRSNI